MLTPIKIIKKTTGLKNDVYDVEVKDSHHYILKNGIISHNSGGFYAGSIIIYLRKKKAKDKDGNVCGFYFNCRTVKNRFCKPESKIQIYLDFKRGLYPYFGLQDFGGAMLVKEKKGWLLNGQSVTDKDLWKMEWPKEVIEEIKKNVSNKFSFGSDLVGEVEIPEDGISLDEENKEEEIE